LRRKKTIVINLLKIGGSLALYPEKLRKLCTTLSKLSEKHSIVLVPGGGEFADTIRKVDTRFVLSSKITHRMAILGMDQYGLLLSDLTNNSLAVDSLEGVKKTLASGKMPILLPSKLLSQDEVLENSWEVTSDSIAIYIAHLLSACKVILVSDVDGILSDDPKTNSNAELMKRISVDEILALKKRTSVDNFVPKLLRKWPLDCFVVGGLFPERVEAILAGRDTICTRIIMLSVLNQQ
jgi:5-(aminomethyl)-3-furanmethanol phosphate kinase